jgi:hypothetical protein
MRAPEVVFEIFTVAGAFGRTVSTTSVVNVAVPRVAETGTRMIPENPATGSMRTEPFENERLLTFARENGTETSAPDGMPVTGREPSTDGGTMSLEPARATGVRETVKVEVAYRPTASATR